MLPSTEALGIPELLGMVLGYAAPRDLLLWQRVSKAWQAAIWSSPGIQERLFFRIRETYEKTVGVKHVFANPFVQFFAESKGPRWIFLGDAFDGKKASHPTASWRRMQLSSAALTQLEAIMTPVDERCKKMRVAAQFQITCETGITIGQFADSFKEHVAPCKGTCDAFDCVICILS